MIGRGSKALASPLVLLPVAAVFAFLSTTIVPSDATSKIIRVNLHKETTMKAGLFGLPITTYYTSVNVGFPPKQFNMSIDLDAKETWVPSGRYSKRDSTTGNSTNLDPNRGVDVVFTFEQDQGTLEGIGYVDTFELKYINESPDRPFFWQRFLGVTSNRTNARFPEHGVISFNAQAQSATGTRQMLQNLLQIKLIGQPIFSLWLDSDPDGNKGGELTLGGFNPTRYVGVMVRHRIVTNDDRWALSLKEVLLGDTIISCYHKNCIATLSIGANDFFGPRDDVLRIIEALRSVNGGIRIEQSSSKGDLYELDCLNVAHLPAMYFVINDVPYTVEPADYVRKKEDGTCYLSILPSDSSKHWVLGSNFLSKFYAVFDYNKREVGLAARTGKTLCFGRS